MDSTTMLGIPPRREHARQLCERVTAEHARGVTLTTQPFAETMQSLSGSPQWAWTQGAHDPSGRDVVLHLGAVRRQYPLLRATIRKIPPHVTEPGWAQDGHHRGGSTLPQRACNGVTRNWRGFHHATPFTATGVEESSFYVSREPHCGPDTRNLTFRADVTALCTTARCV